MVDPNGAGKTTFIRALAGCCGKRRGRFACVREPPGPRIAAGIGYMTQSLRCTRT
jgi:ABC-type Mn2+/Zn2+ transport system ATPase subunit